MTNLNVKRATSIAIASIILFSGCNKIPDDHLAPKQSDYILIPTQTANNAIKRKIPTNSAWKLNQQTGELEFCEFKKILTCHKQKYEN